MSSWLSLTIASILLRAFQFNTLEYDDALNEAAVQVPIVNSLFYDAAQATILMSTLELVLGLRHVTATGHHAHGTSSKPRVFGFVAFALALTIAIGKLASMEVQWKLDYADYEQYMHASRAVIVLFFVLCVVFCLNAIFVLIQACRAPRAIETHQMYTFLIVISSLTLLRMLFDVIISGVYDLSQLTSMYLVLSTPIGLIIASVIIRSWSLAAGLILAHIVITKKYGGIWTRHAVHHEAVLGHHTHVKYEGTSFSR
jgi:hypothetical protein